MTEKPKTRAELEAAIADLTTELGNMRQAFSTKCREIDQSIEREKAARDQFADLKQRLITAEADNQRMRGYITRVQEDDVVREELIPVGDPAGEQRLVPKRKAEPFDQPSPYRMDGELERHSYTAVGRDRPAPKHWITY